MLTKISLIIILFVSAVFNLNAQVQFQRAFGSSSGNEEANSIVQTTDGGYVICGTTTVSGNSDFLVVKISNTYTLQWSISIGGSSTEIANSIIQSTDGGYVVVGSTSSFGAGSSDVYIVKLSSSGTIQWNRAIGGASVDIANSVFQAANGDFIIGGYTTSYGAGLNDFFIVRLDASGTLITSRVAGGAGNDEAHSVYRTFTPGFLIAGSTTSYGQGLQDVCVMLFDNTLTLQTTRTIGGTGIDHGRSVIQTSDSGFAIAGYTASFGAGAFDVYIAKFTGSGTLQWTRTVGGTANEYGYSIIQGSGGGYAISGQTNSYGAGSTDCYIVKLNSGGVTTSTITVGGVVNDACYSSSTTTDGGTILGGLTSSFGVGNNDCFIVKFDAANTCANTTNPSSSSGVGGVAGTPSPSVSTPSPSVSLPSPSTNSGGTLTNICTVTGIYPVSNEIPSSFELYQNYPNPFNPVTTIKFDIPNASYVKLIVYDILGKEVATLVNQRVEIGRYMLNFDASGLSSGVYFYRLEAGDPTGRSGHVVRAIKKMLIVK